MKITGAIFDLDGTVLDSMHLWDSIAADYLTYRGVTPEDDIYEATKDMSLAEIADYYREKYGIDEDVRTIRDNINKMVENEYLNVVLPKSGIRSVLTVLDGENVKMCIATATDRHLVEAALERNGLSRFFSEIYTCSSVGASKSSPLIFEKALEHLGTPKEETYIFEDALYAIKTAKKAGFNVIGVNDKSADRDREAIIELCDDYVVDYDEWGEKTL